MKILYLGNFNSPNAEYISKTLEEMGHEVLRRHEDHTTVDKLRELIKGQDLLFTEEARLKDDYIYGDWEKGELDRCKGGMKEIMKEIKTIAWMTNVFWAIPERVHLIKENPIFKAHTVFSTDGGREKEWKEAGVNHVCVRQGIFEPEAVLGDAFTQFDVGFVGEDNQRFWSYRRELLNFLKNNFIFEWAGQKSRRGIVWGIKLNDFIASVKVMVGDSVYSPHYWSNRVYEMIGRGAFLIMPNIPGLNEEFKEGEHYVEYEFGNFDDLKEKVLYYLDNEEEREKIKMAGFEYCKNNYTYRHRLEKILKWI